ncbi:MAG: hypothetical protein FWG80_04560 [Alphaproteobacteria bacterium]|nr:hypothetical protein [Alphaproteobacteria bacterium]
MFLIKRFFSNFNIGRALLCFLLLFHLSMPLGAQTGNVQSNIPGSGDIGPFGTWNTPSNLDIVKTNLSEISRFQSQFQQNFTEEDGMIVLKKDFVPIEARIGRAVIGAFSAIGKAIDRSLFGFITILIIVLFAFWIMMESYQVIKGDGKNVGDVKKLGLEIVRKGLWITICFILLSKNPAELFMWIMSPAITIGTYISDMILNAVTSAANVSLPDTCETIHEYMKQYPIRHAPISPEHTANLLCVPTRLTGFFYTCVSAGLKWMAAGINVPVGLGVGMTAGLAVSAIVSPTAGLTTAAVVSTVTGVTSGGSAMTFFAGLAFVILFLYNIWKFAIQAIGVIARMFIIIIMLPFTALVECFDGSTNYKGPVAKIFESFAGMFKAVKLENQIKEFLNAIIYFIVLSIIAAIGLALLSPVISADLAETPTVQSSGFMIAIITGLLVMHLVNKAVDLAKDLGGSIDAKFGEQVEKDIKHYGKRGWETTKGWWKAIRKKS